MLKQYHVKIDIPYPIDGDIMDVVSPGEARRTSAITFAFALW
jgi:hypothetical protein